MSLKTFESLKLKLTDDKCPFVVTSTGTSMEPIGFTQCSFNINGHSFTQKFINNNNNNNVYFRIYTCTLNSNKQTSVGLT